MKNWSNALFPLSILVALTGLTFWLRLATELPEIRNDGKYRHDADFVAANFSLRKIDKTGSLQYTLTGNEMRHYPDDDTTDLVKPNLIYLKTKKPKLTVSAEKAHYNKGGEQLDLYDNVIIQRDATPKEEALLATTSQLTFLPEEEKAFTKSAVQITKGQSWIKGVGMRMDNRTQTYVLESQARAVLESKHAKK